MKFSTYEPAVNPNTLQNVPVHVNRDINVYGGKGGGEQWKALGQLATVGLEMQKKVTDGKVMEANNEYNRLMSEGTMELMQRKEQNALNITEDYDKLQRQVLGQVRQKYGSFIGTGPGAEAFNNFTERDNITRREGMMKYQMGETEKYQETQYQNQLASCFQFAGNSGYTDAGLSAGMNRAEPFIRSRYANYGEEEIQRQLRAVKAQMISEAVSVAINTGDYARMDSLCDKYGSAMNPKDRAALLTMIRKRSKKADDLSFNQKAIDALGFDFTREQAIEYIRNNLPVSEETAKTFHHKFYDMTKGAPYLLGAAPGETDNSDRHYDCGLWTQRCYASAGLTLESRCADEQYTQMKEEGRAFTDRSQLQDGDLVFWTHTGGEEGDWGIAHVGIYDADTGKVMQSGSRGVGEIDLDTYDIVGFGHGPKSDTTVSELDAEEKADALIAFRDKRRTEVRAAENVTIENGTLAILDSMMNGGEDPNLIAAQYAQGQSDRVRIKLQQAALGVERANARSASRRARGESEPTDAEVTGFFDEKIVYALDHGHMTVDQAREYIFKNEDISNSKKEKLIKMLERYTLGEKEFSYDWKNIESDVASLLGAKKSELGALWGLIKKSTLADIREYMHEHDGESPTQQWVIDTCVKNGMAVEVKKQNKGWFESDDVELTSAAALRDKGVEIRSDNGDGTYNIALLDSQGNPVGTFRISAGDMVEIARSNLPAKEVLGLDRNRVNIEE